MPLLKPLLMPRKQEKLVMVKFSSLILNKPFESVQKKLELKRFKDFTE